MAIIVVSISIARLYVRAIQNVMAPLVGFYDGGPNDEDERDNRSVSMTMFSIPSAKDHRGSTGHSGQ